jgi:hypothetical protein
LIWTDFVVVVVENLTNHSQLNYVSPAYSNQMLDSMIQVDQSLKEKK